jgi:hypothetical protein
MRRQRRQVNGSRPIAASLVSRALGTSFSMTEILSANAVMLAIAVGVVPIFVGALTHESGSGDLALASHFARSRMEEMLDLEFDDGALAVVAGDHRVITEFYSSAEDSWSTVPPGRGEEPATWVRVTTVRQYGIDALDDGKVEPAESLDADAPRERVRLKEILVDVRRSGRVFLPAEKVSLRTVRMS